MHRPSPQSEKWPITVRISLLADQLVVDVQLQRADALAVLAHPLLGELDADDVRPDVGTGAEMRSSGGMPRKL